MRRLVVLLPAVLGLACPPPKPPPEPEPSGRCEVELDALGLFSKVGGGARAKEIETADELVGGPWAQGAVGDFLLENDRIRAVIQRPSRTLSPAPFGGALVDADLRRASGAAGQDVLGRLAVLTAFGRGVEVTRVEVLADGARGGYAVVAATGPDALVDTFNVKSALPTELGAVALAIDPDAPLPFLATTYYVLSPGETRVRVLTAFCNPGRDDVVVPVGDLLVPGGEADFFNPGGCAGGFGAGPCLLDSASWVGLQANGVAVALRPYRFGAPDQPAANGLVTAAGVAAVIAEAEGEAGLRTWLDAAAIRRPGAFGVLAAGQRSYLRDLFVGRDLGELSSTFLQLDGAGRARLGLTVELPGGAPAPGARVAVVAADSGKMVTALVADTLGKARVDLPQGNYLVSAGAPGRALVAPRPVSVPASGEVTATVALGATRSLAVEVQDPFGRPLVAKVVVTCPAGPCATPPASWRRYATVEDLPSSVQAVAFTDASGRATVAVPPGAYEVLVSRGPEYSAFPAGFPVSGEPVDVTSADATLSATLARVVDSSGWMSADLDVHALASPDSATPEALRVLSLAAEGVDVAVLTDHDVVTDAAAAIRALGLEGQVASLVGSELSPFDFGHLQVFNLTRGDGPTGGALDWAGGDGPTLRLPELVERLRATWPEAVVQLGHPRGPYGALTRLRVDTATGASHADPATFRQAADPQATSGDTRLFPADLDALEVMRGPAVDLAVVNDWMTFLSRGVLTTATGASDAHHAFRSPAGAGRTWLSVGADAPGQLQPPAFTQALRARRAVASSGPFVVMTARRLDSGGAPVGAPAGIGETLSVDPQALETVRLTVDVQAPEWMQFDAIELYSHAPGREAVDGVANASWPAARVVQRRALSPAALTLEAVPDLNGFSARRVHEVAVFDVSPTGDTWYVAMVRSSAAARRLFPVAWGAVTCSGGVCDAASARAEALTNAILVDADRSGAYDHFPQ